MFNGKLWNRLLITPAFLSTAFLMATPSIAAEAEAAQKNSKQLEASSLAPETLALAQPSEQPTLPVTESITELPAAPSTEVQPLVSVDSLTQPVVVADQSLSQPASVESISQVEPSSQIAEATVLNEMSQYTGVDALNNTDPMAQVTSITQFSDVRPTDWAYQALQSLVERYGCIVGYPDGTYRGQRALTRFEFAAGMNACLDRISELLAAATADLATKEDLATLQRLQEEFAAELAALRGRVDELDSRVTELEANQFSTTTKLAGETIFVVAGTAGGGLDLDDDDDDDDDDDPDLENQIIAGGRVRLAFDTSFYGNDRLRARLQAGDVSNFGTVDSAGNTVLGNEARLGFTTDTDAAVELDILSYLFEVGPASVMLAGQVGDFTDIDFINTVSPFASGGRGAISRFGRFNPIYRTAGGSGLALGFDLDFASLQLAYLAGEAGNPALGAGLTNGNYGALAQLTLTPLDAVTLALTYVNSYAGSTENDDGSFSAIGFNTGTGSTRSRVRVGDQPIVANSYGASLNVRVADFLQIGGWATYSAVRVIDSGDADVFTWAGTLGFPDLGGKGNLLGFVVGMQPRLTGTDEADFLISARRSDPDAGLHVEGFYRFQLNSNISITPGVVWLTAPNHNEDNEDVFVGAIRTTFTF